MVVAAVAAIMLSLLSHFRLEADDLITPQGLEKWLKTAADQATQNVTVNFYLAHS
jgi:hypothetical protein